MNLKQKTIICGSCGFVILIVTQAFAMPTHAYVDISHRGAIAISKVHHASFGVAQSHIRKIEHKPDYGLIMIEDDSSFPEKETPPKKTPIRITSIATMVMRLGDFSKFEKSSYFKEHGNKPHYQGKISRRLGKKNNFPIKQPLNRASAYKYKKKTI